ncbi:glycosyltransferase family 2 protein [Brevibacterium casei]|uniref:glycosyltransferase family 2 protein n=1 Tax=Brevibacterium casei TaxID=33889 RepID=UPI00223BD5BD|nr:glycosyltransferase [Brevibacterium casei]MCT1550177.1 glycosyltransferase [Brevibacterium casei]MCT1560115.1 glycosyltransferase [Brevibacterium casei]MCT2208269.1 glycosyltransferase [Brevibacterium casei]
MTDERPPTSTGERSRTSQSEPTLSVIIATLGRPDHLSAALGSLRSSSDQPEEVLIVDGSANSDALELTQRHDAGSPYPVRHVHSAPGLTRQRNVGLDSAVGDVVLFLDDDAKVPAQALREVRNAYSDPEVIGATARIVEPFGNDVGGKVSALRRAFNAGGAPGSFTSSGFPRRLQDEAVRQDIEFMQGAFMSARLAEARRVRFDETLVGYGLAEDEDFSYRLSRLGRIRYLGDVEIEHDNAGFSNRDRVVFARTVVRNRRYLFHKNFEQSRRSRAAFALLLGTLVVHRLLNREFAAASAVAGSALRGEETGKGPLR